MMRQLSGGLESRAYLEVFKNALIRVKKNLGIVVINLK